MSESPTSEPPEDAPAWSRDPAGLYRKLFAHVTESVVVLDARGRILFGTSHRLSAMGAAADGAVGRDAFEVVHPEDRQQAWSLFTEVASGAAPAVQRRLRVWSDAEEWLTVECIAHNLLEDPDVRGIVIVSRDVTAEVARQQELVRSEEQLRLVLNQMPCLLWTTDRELRVTSVRGRAVGPVARLLGRRLDHVAGTAAGEGPMIAAHRTALDGGRATYSAPLLGAPHEAQVEPLREGDEITGVIGVAVDVTRHVETEERLRMQHEVLQRILDNLPLMVALYDGAGNFIWVNRFWTETLGWSLEDTWRRDFLPRLLRNTDAAARFRQVIADSSGEWQDVQLTTRGGAVLTATWSNVRLPDGTCVGIGRDVTEVRRAADRLRESEERYRLLIESSQQVFFYIHDLDGVFQYVSPSVEAVLGYAPEALVGRSFGVVVPEPHAGEVMSRTRAAFELRAPQPPYIAVNRRRDGTEVLLEITESPLIRDGVVIGMQGFARDVTQLRRLEEQVQHAQRMEAVGRLAGGVAHDFNNILTVIDGNAEIGLLEPELAAPVRECLEQVRAAAERGTRLTRQLLAFSRKQVVQRTPLDVNETARGMQRMLARLIGDDVTLRVEVAAEPAWVLADAGQLEQVLLNLAVNARAAMPRGGELHIVTRPAEPADTGRPLEGAWLLLEVTDTGHGIEPTVLPHIFDPFFTTRARGEGTGLGLATTYAIVEATGGWIEVQSRPGAGARFRIFLPRSAPPAGEPRAPAAEPAVGGPETILVAEDDPAVRGVLRHTLRRLGYTLLEAADGVAALELLRERGGEVSLIVSDVMMPRMGGIELARRAHELHPDVPVLFISGYTDDAPDLRRRGSAPLLNKPFTSTQLAAAVRALLDERRAPPDQPPG